MKPTQPKKQTIAQWLDGLPQRIVSRFCAHPLAPLKCGLPYFIGSFDLFCLLRILLS